MIKNLLATLSLTFVFILLSAIGLGIGRLLTGKTKLRSSCGGKGSQLSECEGEDEHCSICGQKTDKK